MALIKKIGTIHTLMSPLTEQAPAPPTSERPDRTKSDIEELARVNQELRELLRQGESLMQRIEKQLAAEKMRQAGAPVITPENVFETLPN